MLYLVIVVSITVQSPSIGCNLNRVVKCVAEKWLLLL